MSELKVDKVSPRTGTYVSLNTVGSKNIIINGDMSIAQRSTSVASITGPGYYTVDRFNTLLTSMGTWTQSQDNDVPSGQGFAKSLKMACTTADASPAAADIIALRLNIIEGQNLQYLKFGTSSAESLTLSFWVKSNKTGTYIVSFYIGNGGYQLGKTVTINSADTWEKKIITIIGDTAHNFTNDNSAQLYLTFYLGVGSDRTSGTLPSTWTAYSVGDEAPGQTVNLADNTSNYINITGVQLEAGTTASDFEFLPVDVNLGRCFRYFQSLDLGQLGFGFATANLQWMYINVGLATVMRANPTATQGATSASGSTNAIGVSITRPQQFVYQLQASGSGSDIYALGTSAQITLSAEL